MTASMPRVEERQVLALLVWIESEPAPSAEFSNPCLQIRRTIVADLCPLESVALVTEWLDIADVMIASLC